MTQKFSAQPGKCPACQSQLGGVEQILVLQDTGLVVLPSPEELLGLLLLRELLVAQWIGDPVGHEVDSVQDASDGGGGVDGRDGLGEEVAVASGGAGTGTCP